MAGGLRSQLQDASEGLRPGVRAEADEPAFTKDSQGRKA